MNNLKKLRLGRGLSQQALADQLEISQQSVYKYENQITEPNIDMLKHIADFFDVSIDYLTGNSSCAHKIEEVSRVNYMRFLCRIYELCCSVCENRSKHDVNSCAYAYAVKKYLSSLQAIRFCGNAAFILFSDRSAQCLKAFYMLIDRS